MSKTRKILSVVLALVMVFSLATVAFAVDYEEATTTNEQIWALGTPVANGNNWDIPVNLTTNYDTGAIQFDLAYDGVTFVSAKIGSAVYYTDEIQPATDGSRFVIIPDTSSLEDSTATIINGTIATITVSGTSGSVTLDKSPKTATNPSGTLIAVRVEDGDLITGNLVAGQKVNATANVATIGGAPAGDPELVVKEGTNGYIDDTTECVYGIDVLDACETVEDVFEVTNGGSIEIDPSSFGETTGTGAILHALDADGVEFAKYTVVIFGDINGDGCVDASDANAICEWEAGVNDIEDFSQFGISDEVAFIAGDIDGSFEPDASDANAICEWEAGVTDDDFPYDIASYAAEVYAYYNA